MSSNNLFKSNVTYKLFACKSYKYIYLNKQSLALNNPQ